MSDIDNCISGVVINNDSVVIHTSITGIQTLRSNEVRIDISAIADRYIDRWDDPTYYS